jgi:hypothetical protein
MLRNSLRSRAWGGGSGCSYRVESCRIIKVGVEPFLGIWKPPWNQQWGGEVGHSEYAMQALPMLLCETWSFHRCRGQADIIHCEGWWYIADARLRVVCMAVEDVDVLTWQWMNGFPDRRWQHRAWALFDTDACCCPNPCPCCVRTDCYHQSCMLCK